MKHLIQIDGSDPRKWQTIEATNREAAILKAIRPLIEAGMTPTRAYVALGETRHPNGAPVCVQSFTLHLKRTATAQEAAQ